MKMLIRLSPLPTIGELLQLYRLRAQKKLSQNFLLDLNLTTKIVNTSKSIEGKEVCEIGPGPGGITRSIMSQNPSRIIVIEKDARFKPILESLSKCSICKFDMIFADILDFDLSELFSASLKKEWEHSPPTIHLIGNLPFSVSTPLVIRWLKDISLRRNAWALGRVPMTLTFQEEVAQRMTAPILSKFRCRMSVMCQNWCKVSHKFTIPGKAFLPKPDVNVGVVTLEPMKEPLIPLDFELVEKVLRTTFNGRQKYSYNSAKNLFPAELREGLTKELFGVADIDPKTRPYQITNQEWGKLCWAYKRICDRDPRLHSYDFRGPRNSKEETWKNPRAEAEEEEREEQKASGQKNENYQNEILI